MNRQQKAQAIREAALRLFLKRGVEGVSVDDIMLAARMAKGSFYRYFDDQPALVAALIEDARELITSGLKACSVALESADTRDAQFEAYRQVGEVVTTLVLKYPGETRLYLQENRAPDVGSRRPIIALARVVAKHALEMTRKAQQHGILRPIPVEVSSLTVVGAAERLLLAVLHEEAVGNPLEIPEALTTLILDGLKA